MFKTMTPDALKLTAAIICAAAGTLLGLSCILTGNAVIGVCCVISSCVTARAILS